MNLVDELEDDERVCLVGPTSSHSPPAAAAAAVASPGRSLGRSKRWSVCALICFICYGSQVSYDMPGALAPQLKARMNLTSEDLGALYSAYHLPYCVLVVVGGVLADLIGLGSASVFFSLLFLAGTAVTALSRTFPWMVLGRLLFGMGAESLGVEAHTVDGNDVAAVDGLVADLIPRIRGGSGPIFLSANTYRLKGHTSMDPALYRDQDKVAAQWEVDPLIRAGSELHRLGLADSDLAAIDSAATGEMARVTEAADAADTPALEHAFADIQDIGAPVWEAQS